MSLSTTPRCGVCSSTVRLIRCETCKVMFYCNREHQLLDNPDHKKACDDVDKSRQKIYELERKVLAYPDLGHFISIDKIILQEARYTIDDALVKDLLKINTFNAVEAAFKHSMNVLRQFRINHMDLKYMASALLLRLGKYQECYDFVKWYATAGQETDYEWDDTNQPYLDVTNANMLESIDVFIGENAYLWHIVVAVLIKIRLLQDIKSLNNSIFLYERLPVIIVEQIRQELVNPTLAKTKEIISIQNQDVLINTLESQLKQLYAAAKVSNKYFWSGLLKPDAYLAATTSRIYFDTCHYGSEECAIWAVKIYHDAFFETPGAIDKIAELDKNHTTN